ncbi:hypothetical protein VSDG_06547 [Cytospora chrysosperma]|uniref:Uncharacterized protein n=1 Tax=Cytospora chrysosperma TaxID=252740 RepID=A0A423VP02_CYTCH|nr:hypothetical protein VSDG_06547 [Valsa sordida]
MSSGPNAKGGAPGLSGSPPCRAQPAALFAFACPGVQELHPPSTFAFAQTGLSMLLTASEIPTVHMLLGRV